MACGWSVSPTQPRCRGHSRPWCCLQSHSGSWGSDSAVLCRKQTAALPQPWRPRTVTTHNPGPCSGSACLPLSFPLPDTAPHLSMGPSHVPGQAYPVCGGPGPDPTCTLCLVPPDNLGCFGELLWVG